MPNWCEGNLKVRGTIKELKNFVLNGLIPVDILGAEQPPLEFDEDETSFCVTNITNILYMKDSRRHFSKPKDIELYVSEPEEIVVLILPMKAAWSIDSDCLLNLCKEFKVDMKIQGFERGMQFSQIIEIVDGVILQDDEIEYADWEWDCPHPELGG